jgi:hypothetical protein
MGRLVDYGEGRICYICGVVLCRYNKLNRCFCHGYIEGVEETIQVETESGSDYYANNFGRDPLGFMQAQLDYYGQPWR